MKSFNALVLPSLFYLFSAAASEAPARENEEQANLNGGYYLLHKLCDDESQLPILLDLKTAPKELETFADHISRTAKEDMAVLERMRDADSRMSWDKNPLPKIEQDIRASITDEKQHQLLFGSKGPDFSRALLVSQAEASKYAANIAKVLSEQDKNPEHIRDLKRISAHWQAIYDEAFRLMKNY